MGLNIFNWHGGTPSWDVMQRDRRSDFGDVIFNRDAFTK